MSSLPTHQPTLPLFLLALLFSLILANAHTHQPRLPLLSIPSFSDKQISHQINPLPAVPGSPIDSTTCGHARITQVGVSVVKGSKATLKYKIVVQAISAETLAFSDFPFLNALSESHRAQYMSMRRSYSGGLDIPFLQFLGVNLDDPSGRGNAKAALNDDDFGRLSRIAQGILTEASKQIIRVKGKLKAKGITCMTTTAFAFIKIAKVDISNGEKLTVLNTNDDDLMAATMHADTMLPSEGSVQVKKARKKGKRLTLLNPDVDDVIADPF